MKINFLLALIVISVAELNAQNAVWDWAVRPPITTTAQVVTDVCVDSYGNSYFLSYNEDAVPFYIYSPVLRGATITKVNQWGVQQWTKFIDAYVKRIEADENGQLYAAGSFTQNFQVGSFTAANEGGTDIFLMKLNAAGSPQWLRTFGDSLNDELGDIAVCGSGNVYLGAALTCSFQLGGVTLDDSTNFCLVKFEPAGTPLWGRSQPFEQGAQGYRIMELATDPAENVYLLTAKTPTPCGYYCVEYGVMKYSATGVIQFNQNKWGVWDDPGQLRADEQQNVYVISNTGSHYETALLLTKYSSQMQKLWSTYLGNGYDGHMLSNIALSGDSIVFAGGTFGGEYMAGDTMTIGSTLITRAGNSDMVIARMNANNGTFIDAFAAGARNNEYISQICTDKQGNCYLGGEFGFSYSATAAADTMCFEAICLPAQGNYYHGVAAKLKVSPADFSTTRVESLSGMQQVLVAPNPASDKVLVTFTDNESRSVTLRDTMGKEILRTQATAQLTLDCNSLPPGIYFIEARSRNTVTTHKLVVNR